MFGAALKPASARAWIAAGAPILGLVLVTMSVALALLWASARDRDKGFVDTSTRLIASAWQARVTATARVALDYAFWNDAYLGTTDRWDAEWVENNLYSSLADAILVVRADGRVRHAWMSENVSQSELIVDGVVRAARSELNLGALLSAPTNQEAIASTLFTIGDELVLLSVAPISPEEETVRQARNPDLPVDYLVAVDVVTAADLGILGASLQAEGLHFAPSADLRSDQVPHVLQDASGRVVGSLSWDRQRPGSDAFLGQAGMILLALLLVGGLAVILARRLVDEQVRAAAELNGAQEASRMKSEFISTMSHELRTPLNAIMGYAELIKEGVEDGASPAAIASDASRVLDAAKHLLRLINDVLDQSRIDAGRLNVAVEPVEIAAVMEELEELMWPLAQVNSNRLTFEVGEGAAFVMADPMRLQQCLINLTGNALKFTRNGDVVVRVRRLLDHANDFVCFEISDTGIGMDRAELAGLFKPFAQANKNVAARYGGTGLGLSITRSLARAMGGDVTAQSTLGQGSVFSLCLPAADVRERSKPRLVSAA